MSWHYSRALEEEFSEVTCSDGELSAPSSGCRTLETSSCNGKTMESCDHSRSGTTCRPSTGDHGLDLWMSSLEASRAKTSVQQGKARGSTAHVPECGSTWPGSFARFDRDSSLWRTPQCSLLEGLDVFLETWPRWGTMRSGVCWERLTPERPTSATGYGFSELLPTPLASIATHGGPNQRDSSGRPGLQMAAMRWPSPRTRWLLGGSGSREMVRAMVEDGLIEEQEAAQMLGVKILPTPCARDWKSGTGAQERPGHALPLSSAIGGQLNPDWVEGLMGWPMNWTCVDRMSDLYFASWEMGFMDENEGGHGAAMRMLRSAFAQEAIWGATGRPDGLREAALLFAELCEHAHRPDQARLFLACAEAPENGVRGVRDGSAPPGAPRGPEEGKQLTGKHSDALQALSQLLARYGKKAWQDGSWENAIPRVAKNVANRVDRLRAIGNGQVPAVAASAFRILAGQLGVTT